MIAQKKFSIGRVGKVALIAMSFCIGGGAYVHNMAVQADDCEGIWEADGTATDATVDWTCGQDTTAPPTWTETDGSYQQKKHSPCEGVTDQTRTCTLGLTDLRPVLIDDGLPTAHWVERFQKTDSCSSDPQGTYDSTPRCCSPN